MAIKLFEKHLCKEIGKHLIFFLSMIFLLFTFIDLFFHSSRISMIKPLEFTLYYIYLFMQSIPLILPLTFLLSIIKVFSEKNAQFELIAIQMGTFSLKRLSLPIFFIAGIVSIFIFMTFQIPGISTKIEEFKTKYSKHEKRDRSNSIQSIILQDQSKLIFQKSTDNILEDVFWIQNDQTIWHIESLLLSGPVPKGTYVDKISKEKEVFEKKQSYKNYIFHQMRVNYSDIQNYLIPFENRSISSLLSLSYHKHYPPKQKAHLNSLLHYKLISIITPFLIVFSLMPFVSRFSRKNATFSLLALALFGYVSFFMIEHSAMTLSLNLLIAPSVALWTPAMAILLISSIFYIRKV